MTQQADYSLSLRDVAIAFGGLRAVDGVSFEVQPGAIVSLIGPNGAGKTTLLNSISGFVRASGSIRYGPHDLIQQPAHRRPALGIGRTFQNLQLFTDMTLLENVLVGLHHTMGGNVLLDLLRFPVIARERRARERALEVLALLQLEGYRDRRAGTLPFGVQKLAGVARALAPRPALLLFDEPAAGLNASEARSFGDMVVNLRREFGVTILLVEHNMRLVMAISDRLVVLDDGRKLAEGTPVEIGRDPRVIQAYLGKVDDSAVGAEVRHELADRS